MHIFLTVFSMFNIVTFRNDPCTSTQNVWEWTRGGEGHQWDVSYCFPSVTYLETVPTATAPASLQPSALIGPGRWQETAQLGTLYIFKTISSSFYFPRSHLPGSECAACSSSPGRARPSSPRTAPTSRTPASRPPWRTPRPCSTLCKSAAMVCMHIREEVSWELAIFSPTHTALLIGHCCKCPWCLRF